MANYQLGTDSAWSPRITTDAATLAAGAETGTGSGGTITYIAGGGADGDCWEFALTAGGSDQKRITWTGLNVSVGSAVGLWVNFNDFDNIQKVAIYFDNGNGAFTNYFAHTIIGDALEGSQGWVFISRGLDEFQVNGTADWSLPIQSIRIIVIGDGAAVAGSTVRVGNLHTYLYTRPKVMFFLDDANESDLTVVEPILTAAGFVGNSAIIESKVGTTDFLSVAQIASLKAAGWSIMSHHITELDTLTEAEQATLMQEAREYIQGLGYDEGKYFGLPGGKFDINTYPASQTAGIEALRTTLVSGQNPAIKHDNFTMHAADTSAGGVNETAVKLLALLDKAIASRSTFGTYTHAVSAGATGIHTTTAVFQAYVTGVKARVDAGQCDVVNIEQYLEGLGDSAWSPPPGKLR